MDRRWSTIDSIATALFGAGVVGLIACWTIQGTSQGAGIPRWIWVAFIVLCGLGIVLFAISLSTAGHGGKYVQTTRPAQDGSHYFTLGREDGSNFGYAVPRIFRRRFLLRDVDRGEPSTVKKTSQQGQAVTYCYPDHFADAHRPVPVGKYRVRWSLAHHADPALRRGRSGRKVATTNFEVTEADHATAEAVFRRGMYEASHGQGDPGGGDVQLHVRRHGLALGALRAELRQRLPDGSLGEPYSGYFESQGLEGDLRVPDDFRREVGEATTPMPSGLMAIQTDYEALVADAGDYEVVWKLVAWKTGGTFAADHEVTAEDLKVEFDVAQDRFTIAPNGVLVEDAQGGVTDELGAVW